MDQAIRMRTAKEEGLAEGLEKGRTRGIAEGMERGIAQGRSEERTELARKLKQKNMPVEEIMELTGLTREEMETL